MAATQGENRTGGWTFLTNHAHVLVCIAEDPDIRGRDIAALVGITERAAQAIVSDLVEEGYVTRTKLGRRNHYTVKPGRPAAPPARARPHHRRAAGHPRPAQAPPDPPSGLSSQGAQDETSGHSTRRASGIGPPHCEHVP